MIPRIHKSGTSFKAAIAYITHDPDKAKTSDRVEWTHTINCANDDVRVALDEMLWTYRDADKLKEQAHVRDGGRALELPVKHFTLAWHPSENPSQEEMIAATQSYLKHMKWDEHQVVLAAHNDTDHAHVHGILNAVHPETGLKLDDSFERRRSQEWALAYEHEHGKIFCEERLVPAEDREASPPRNAWEALKANEPQHEQAEKVRQDFDAKHQASQARHPQDAEWKELKEQQKQERQAFFSDGKQAYSDAKKDVYREVREEFRDQWADYYAAKRDGGASDDLAEKRVGILEQQNEALHERQRDACDVLRQQRNQDYAEILSVQRDERHELHQRQVEGLSSPHIMEAAKERVADYQSNGALNENVMAADRSGDVRTWREAALEATSRGDDAGLVAEGSRHDTGGDVSLPMNEAFGALTETWKVFGSVASLGRAAESLSSLFEFGQPVKPEPRVPPPREEFPAENPFQRHALAARKNAEREVTEERDRAYWDDRDRQRDP
jgi:hypothetical protein